MMCDACGSEEDVQQDEKTKTSNHNHNHTTAHPPSPTHLERRLQALGRVQHGGLGLLHESVQLFLLLALGSAGQLG